MKLGVGFFTLFLILFIINSCSDSTKSEREREVEKMIHNACKQGITSPRESVQNLLVCDSIVTSEGLSVSNNVKKEIGQGYLRINEWNSAMFYLRKAQSDSKSKDDLMQVYTILSNLYINFQKLDSAKMCLDKALELSRNSASELDVINLKVTQGRLLMKRGYLKEAVQKFLDTFNFYLETGNDVKVMRTALKIGNLFVELREYEQSRIYYRHALKLIRRETGNMNVYELIGTSYRKEGKLDSALVYYNKILTSIPKGVPRNTLVNTYFNLGGIYESQGKINLAKTMFEEALHICEENGNIFVEEEIRRLSHAGLVMLNGDYEKGINIIKSLTVENDTRNITLRDNYFWLGRAYEGKGDFSKALHYYKLYTALKDSISNVVIRESSLLKEKEFHVKHKNEEISNLKQSSNKDKLIAFIMIGILVLVIITLVFIVLWGIKKRLLVEKEKQLADQEKRILSTELEYKNRELTSNLLHLASLNSISQQVKDFLNALVLENKGINRKDLYDIFNYLDNQTHDERWSEFYQRFDELEGDFLTKIAALYPELTASEIRLCGLLRLNLSSKDIAFLTNRSLRTVENLRYRLRKKIGLAKDDSLIRHLMTL